MGAWRDLCYAGLWLYHHVTVALYAAALSAQSHIILFDYLLFFTVLILILFTIKPSDLFVFDLFH